MKVFIIPSWHPTPEKPNWCNWIKPHIKLAKSIANEVVVLQVDQEAQGNNNEIIEISKNHYYVAAGIKNKKRILFVFGAQLREYFLKLNMLYSYAVGKHGKPNIIHAHVSMPAGYGASMLGKKYNIPVLVTEHYSGFFSDNRFFWRLGNYYQKMRNQINGLYAVSPGFKNRIERFTNLKVDGVTPNPVDIEVFKINESKINNDIIQFVSTGNLNEIKGTDILLKAFSKLDVEYEWHLTIVGNKLPNHKKFLSELIEAIPSKRLTILEPMEQRDLCQVYNKSDVYIVSSRIETANVSMLEAMACGCYVITNKIEAPETLLNKDVSVFFDNTDESLSKCIVEVLKNPIPNRKSQRNYIIDHFSNEILSKKLNEIYKKYI